MSSTMWVSREELFKLSAMPSLPITAAPLRHIYNEEDLAIPALKPSAMCSPASEGQRQSWMQLGHDANDLDCGGRRRNKPDGPRGKHCLNAYRNAIYDEFDILSYCRDNKIELDHIVGCIPQKICLMRC
ncbi:hypothetical protein ZWY2020_054822 [Hordeum vulgare]|nr:hypothetical protein ZWY2020_054822 [Hordeum vulgare]